MWYLGSAFANCSTPFHSFLSASTWIQSFFTTLLIGWSWRMFGEGLVSIVGSKGKMYWVTQSSWQVLPICCEAKHPSDSGWIGLLAINSPEVSCLAIFGLRIDAKTASQTVSPTIRNTWDWPNFGIFCNLSGSLTPEVRQLFTPGDHTQSQSIHF